MIALDKFKMVDGDSSQFNGAFGKVIVTFHASNAVEGFDMSFLGDNVNTKTNYFSVAVVDDENHTIGYAENKFLDMAINQAYAEMARLAAVSDFENNFL